MLSAFPAVYEVLADDCRPSTSSSEVEETITSRDAFCAPVSIMVSKYKCFVQHLCLIVARNPRRPNGEVVEAVVVVVTNLSLFSNRI